MLPKDLLKAVENGNVRKFYKSTVWKHKRKEILKRDNYECQKCKNKGRFSKAKIVHHIKHLREYPELALDDENLLSVCGACHNILHPEKNFKANQVNKKEPITPERW
jgi:5-methylcytosine-specific restriction endonuclease McrA